MISQQEGFPMQILIRCPQDAIQRMQELPLSRALHITDIGCFPEARKHQVTRPRGSENHILIYCSAGRGWYELEHRHGTIGPGQALLIPAATPHTYGSEVDGFWKIHWIHFSGSEALAAMGTLSESAEQNVISIPPILRTAEAFENCLRAVTGVYSDDILMTMSGALIQLIGQLRRSRRPMGEAARRAEDRVRSSVEAMKANLETALSLEQLAAGTALSVSHYCAIFRKCLGTTPMRLYEILRMQRACEFLQSTHLPIREIAQLSGYPDPYYFSRAFRKVIGTSPSAYRSESALVDK